MSLLQIGADMLTATTDRIRLLAQTRLGFIATPLAGPFGQIPVYVATRVLAVVLLAGGTYAYLKVRDARVERDVSIRYEREAKKQRDDHIKELRAAAERTAAEIDRVESIWKKQVIEMGTATGALEAELQKEQERNAALLKAGKPVNCAYGPGTLKLLKEKAARANRRYLK